MQHKKTLKSITKITKYGQGEKKKRKEKEKKKRVHFKTASTPFY